MFSSCCYPRLTRRRQRHASRQGLLLSLLITAGVFWPTLGAGHEIPADVRVQMYVKAQDDAISVLMRVPLASMRDIDFALEGPGYLDLAAARTQLAEAVTLWLSGELNFDLEGEPLGPAELVAVRLALPSDASFADYDSARHAIAEQRLDPATQLYWEQALLDVSLRYPLPRRTGELYFAPSLARLGLKTVVEVRHLTDTGEIRDLVFTGDPGRISLTPGVVSVFRLFLADGFVHVLGGLDHLLFLAALILPVRRLRPLIVIVTAFTLAHCITLSAGALGLVPESLWFIPLVEMLVAGSIVFMALENIILPGLHRRWLIAYGFGLVHGFAFSFTLTNMLQFSGDHLLVSLLAFNLGIEFGQLLVLLISFPLLRLLFDRLPRRPALIVLSALIAHTGWHWLTERMAVLSQFRFSMPVLDAAFFASASSWLTLLLIAVFIVWIARWLVARFGWAAALD